ncbi:hypothetical protein CSB93_1205 [Pseudomonas paraeruginosa]|uniref:Uncharacterized protein n=1 Tax=Pseudomonas paraeruginosa TaxID=2994495 RepID=A0A2R3J2N8_9PSED|nr:hypothetical protein CSB93_1205 [Pseudomonas paraeruginosa]AWE90446.1 hypothetical protein CSC28_6521 [Pseudomonas paraeruginosa]
MLAIIGLRQRHYFLVRIQQGSQPLTKHLVLVGNDRSDWHGRIVR